MNAVSIDTRALVARVLPHDHLASDEIVWLNMSREDWQEALRWLGTDFGPVRER